MILIHTFSTSVSFLDQLDYCNSTGWLCEDITLWCHSFVVSGAAHRSGQTHKGCPACFASDNGEVHEYLPPHPVLYLHLQSHWTNSEPLSGHQSSPAEHRRGKAEMLWFTLTLAIIWKSNRRMPKICNISSVTVKTTFL